LFNDITASSTKKDSIAYWR